MEERFDIVEILERMNAVTGELIEAVKMIQESVQLLLDTQKEILNERESEWESE